MSTTLANLPYRRYVAQVSTGAPRIKSNWKAMMAENLEALKSPLWREARAQAASLADHDFTAATHLNDAYDAFKMTGNYDSAAMTEVGYAGMVAYRFKLPDDYVTGSANVTSISVPVFRDRFCKGGVRLALAFGGSSPYSFGWAEARGEGADVSPKTALMAQSDEAAPYLTASSAADEVAGFELSPLAEKSTYLWLFLTLEDYEDGWEWYSKKEKRLYAIEGSARLAGELLSVSFDADVEPDAAEHEFAVVRGGVVPRLPEGSASGARCLELFRTGDEIVPSFTDATSDPTYTVFSAGGQATEFLGRASDVNVSVPFELDGATTRLVAICGAFERASIPGVPGLVLVDAATGAIVQASSVSGTIDADAAALVRTGASKVGVTICVVDGAPHAYVFATDGSHYTDWAFVEIDLTTGAATAIGTDSGGTSCLVSGGSEIVAFYDAGLADAIGGGYLGANEPPDSVTDVPFCPALALYHTSTGAATDDHRTAWCAYTPLSSWRRHKGSSTPITGMGCLIAHADEAGAEAVTAVSMTGEIAADGQSAKLAFCVAGGFGTLARFNPDLDPDDDPLCEGTTGFGVVLTGAGRGLTPYTDGDAAAYELSPGMAALPGVHLDKPAYGGSGYLAYGSFYEAGGDPALRYALAYDSELATRAALGAPCAPYKVFMLGGQACVVRPRVGGSRQDFYFAGDLPAEPSAANGAAGLRTLQGRFYLGGASAVARTTSARIGAAYSVRAGTKTLKVVTAGTAADAAVPVWRLFASALVVPFAMPTEWRARALRLDWTDWAGTATAGARFNVWIKAGHWQDASPQVLEGDVPYDALKAEADGWTLLGRIDATLAGVARTAEFAVGEKVAGAKVASLMLTAYAPTDGINPADGTAWPVGAGTEVDFAGGEVANAAKAWLPDVTLVG